MAMKFILYTMFTVMAFLILPDVGFAQQRPLVPQACINNVAGCNFCTLLAMGGNIVDLLFQLLVIAAVILIVVAGFKLVTSAGNPQALEGAKSMLTNVIIGFVIIISAWLIVDTIFRMLAQENEGIDFRVWNRIEGVNCVTDSTDSDSGGTVN